MMPNRKFLIDQSTLVAFDNAAAGHDGVLSDPSGSLFIKPCTQSEISFYESAIQSHPALAAYMPTYMGTLTQAASATIEASGKPPSEPAASDFKPSKVGPMPGKALETELFIVMENETAGFAKPNILDVKLGARLWDDEAPQAKRARLDDVAAKSTSGSLGLRIAGMKVWRRKTEGKSDAGNEVTAKGKEKKEGQRLWEYDEESGYTTFNRLYGRSFDQEDVEEGFREFFGLVEGESNETDKYMSQELLAFFSGEVRAIQHVLEGEESRMYSSSLLFVYEGDGRAYEKTMQQLQKVAEERGHDEDEDEDEDEKGDEEMEDDETAQPKIATVKLIDFAHAKWVPGEGPDQNALQGVRSTAEILERIAASLAV